MLRNLSIIIFASLFNYQIAFSQDNSILDNFSVSESNGNVFLNWVIKSGSTCNGIQIFRSTDKVTFRQVGEIVGVCGSLSTPVSYNFTDEHPVINKINHYRLGLGGNGSSSILSVEIIDIGNGGFQIRPNPANAITRIIFDNNKNELCQLSLYSLTGGIHFTFSSKEDFFDFNAVNLRPGLYFFSISSANNSLKASGRIMVQH